MSVTIYSTFNVPALTSIPNLSQSLLQGGIPVSQAVATPTGLLLDRNFAIITAGTCNIIGQNQYHQLSSISVSISDPALLSGELPLESAFDTHLIVSAPWLSDKLKVPLYPSDDPKLMMVGSQDWSGLAVNCTKEAADWFSRALGTAVRLIRYGGTFSSPLPIRDDPLRRQVDPAYCPGRKPHETAFSSSGFPYTIINKASLRKLYGLPGEKEKQQQEDSCSSVPQSPSSLIHMKRQLTSFRPNIVIDGEIFSMFEEDGWSSITIGTHNSEDSLDHNSHKHWCYNQYYLHGDIGEKSSSACWEGGITLDFCKPHVRPARLLVVEKDDDEDGGEGASVLQALMQCRSRSCSKEENISSNDNDDIYFGWNAVSHYVGLIRVGDVVVPRFRKGAVERGGDVPTQQQQQEEKEVRKVPIVAL